MKSLRDDSGQALIVVALALTCVLGFVGLAVDVGALLHDKRELQVAADGAAVAGALHLNYPDVYTAAKNASAANGFTDGSNGVTVTVNKPPLNGEYLNQTGYIEVLVKKTEPTFFMRLFGQGSVPVLARAVARSASTTGNGTGCVYTLGATGTGVTANGNVDLEAPKCGMNIDSNSSQAMVLNGHVTLNLASIGIVGGYSKNGNVSLTPSNPSTGITPYSDPLSYLPGYSCTGGSCTPSGGGSSVSCAAGQTFNGNKNFTLSPGCYNGLTVNGAANVTLSAGTYIINGNLTFNGTGSVSGAGVTFYMASGGVSINGNTTLNLIAPTSGTFNGVLFDQSPSDTSSAAINGDSNSVLEGVMYFPTADVTMNGNSNTTIYTDFVVKTLTLNGNVSFQDYAALSGGVTSPLLVVSLVE
jgi:Flp pilus assembly protein TadG